jgi:demethylmenaquinone methyltransferase / 2-methoxy-6-polyprenyl-1,4-benzoquinol methylase
VTVATEDNRERTRLVGTMFGRIAGRYDLMNRIMTGGLDRRWRRLAVREAMAAGGNSMLDIGTGTGDLALELAKEAGVERVAAFDLALPMLQRAITRPQHGYVSFGLADATRLPFRDASFDAVTTAFMLRNVPDVSAALAEARRVLRPGGRFVCLEITRQDGGLLPKITAVYFKHIVPFVGRRISGDATAYSYLPQSVGRFLSAVELRQAMLTAGFRAAGYRYVGPAGVALNIGTL